MFKLKYSADELPFSQFVAFGLDRKAVLSLPPVDLNALLSGRRTSLLNFKEVELPGGLGRIPSLDAKISLVRNNDTSVSLRIHPINKVAPNIFNLNEVESKVLLNGEKALLVTKVLKENGDKDDMLVQYDPETREFVGQTVNAIVPPRELNHVKLTDEQKLDWKIGNTIEVNGEKIRIDLNAPIGFIGNVHVYGLEGGTNLAIASILKASTRQKIIPDTTNTPNNEKQEARTIKTEFEEKNNLAIPKDNNKKWVKVEDTDYTDNVTVSDEDKFVLVDRDKVGNKDVISLKEYESVSADQSLEVSAQLNNTNKESNHANNLQSKGFNKR